MKILKKIKNVAPDKSVIIMTGYSTKNVAIQALKGRADSYVEKPFDIKEMRDIIEQELAARNGDGDPGDMDVFDKVEYVKRYIERNCFKKIALSDAAAAVYLTPKYLSRVFREKARAGFTEYKLKVKIAQAKKILKSTGLSVKQVSVKLGYENTESFIRQFKKITRHTPSFYRKSRKRRG